MGLVINLIAALLLFWYPIRVYTVGNERVATHPLDRDVMIAINADLNFLVYSIVTAMVFLGPLSLWKYAYWVGALLILTFSRLKIKLDLITGCYLLFVFWGLFSLLFISGAKFDGLMMLVKYVLPLLYLWLAYNAIRDSDDFLYFLRIVTIGMCVYALIIGGFSAKVLGPLYYWLNWGSGGLFISYAPLADYFSSLIVVPLALYLVTDKRIWLLASVWIALSTILETVRTGLGGIFIASSLLFLTIYKLRALPWVMGLALLGAVIVFTVPSFREKMFLDKNVEMSTFSVDQANFQHISNNGREALWDMNLSKFYYPQPLTGAGLGESGAFMKSREGLHLIHSDYVQMLSDLGDIGLGLFALFAIVALVNIISVAWRSDCPDILKLTGGMALGSCGGTFFSMGFDNVVTYAQQSFVLPFVLIGIFLKAKDLYNSGEWK